MIKSFNLSGILLPEILDMLGQGHCVRIRPEGQSMRPMINPSRDTIVLAPPRPETFAVGRIVLAQLGDGRFVVHRITEIKESRLTLRGDGNPYQYEYCHCDLVRGELVAVIRPRGVIRLGDLRWRMYRRLWPQSGFLRRVLLFLYRRYLLLRGGK